jgi:hypothetical protein
VANCNVAFKTVLRQINLFPLKTQRALTDGQHPSGSLKDDCGLPFACVVQPFAKSEILPLEQPPAVSKKDVSRCYSCHGWA